VPEKIALEQLERFGKEVMPAFKGAKVPQPAPARAHCQGHPEKRGGEPIRQPANLLIFLSLGFGFAFSTMRTSPWHCR